MNAFVGSRSTAQLGGILCDSCHKYKPRVAVVQVDDGQSAPTKVRFCVGCARDLVFAARRSVRR